MQSGRSRQHALSKHFHRSQINRALDVLDEGDKPELAWYDDEYPLEDQLMDAYDEWEAYQDEQEEREYWETYDEWEEIPSWDEFMCQGEYAPKPRTNLTRPDGEWRVTL